MLPKFIVLIIGHPPLLNILLQSRVQHLHGFSWHLSLYVTLQKPVPPFLLHFIFQCYHCVLNSSHQSRRCVARLWPPCLLLTPCTWCSLLHLLDIRLYTVWWIKQDNQTQITAFKLPGWWKIVPILGVCFLALIWKICVYISVGSIVHIIHWHSNAE